MFTIQYHFIAFSVANKTGLIAVIKMAVKLDRYF